MAPSFEVDPFWPKPLPNHWILGSAIGVAVDSRDHVYVIHRRQSFNERTEIGAFTDPDRGLDHPNEISAYMFSLYFQAIFSGEEPFKDAPEEAQKNSNGFVEWINRKMKN